MKDQFEQILIHAITSNASDIHIVFKSYLVSFLRINDDLVNLKLSPSIQGDKLINLIKYSSNIDINYRLKPQTGHFTFMYKNKEYYLRVSSIPTKDSENIVIRILNNLDSIDLLSLIDDEYVKDYLIHITKKKKGLVLIGGATGSGKSTTLYTLLDYIYNIKLCNIITLEDPIEIDKPYCIQIQINEEMGITYDNTLRQILRHDPDVIMIGEIRDSQTAKLAVRAALTGHLVLATIHASNCPSMLHRLMDLGVCKIDLNEVVVGLINQTMLFNDYKRTVLMECMNEVEIKNYLECMYCNYYDYEKAMKNMNKGGEDC